MKGISSALSRTVKILHTSLSFRAFCPITPANDEGTQSHKSDTEKGCHTPADLIWVFQLKSPRGEWQLKSLTGVLAVRASPVPLGDLRSALFVPVF